MNFELYIELLEREVFRLRGDTINDNGTQLTSKKKHPFLKALPNKEVKKKVLDDPTEAVDESMLPEDSLAPDEVEKMIPTNEYWDESNATEMPKEEFETLFDSNKRIIEKETFAYSKSWDVWVNSDVKFMIPKNASPAFDIATEKKSYALAESFMYEGKVFAMDRKKPEMFSSPEDALKYIDTLFAVFLVYQAVSPIDRLTIRYYVVGCTEDQGTVPTHGL